MKTKVLEYSSALMATAGSKMSGRLAMAVACCVLLSSAATAAAMEPHHKGKITVYWGQNAMEGSLRQACESNLYSTVIISFLTYSHSGRNYKLDLADHPWHPVGDDIKYCQYRGILVLLAITVEEDTGGKYSVPSKDEAIELGKHVWDNYLGGQSPHRPFGDAVLDGIDFYDIKLGDMDKHIDEHKKHDDDPEKHDHSKHLDDLAMFLKEYSKGKKKVWITATPQCLPFPDHPAVIGDALRSGIIDRVHVLFYNNPFCSYRYDNEAAFTHTWNQWASSLPKSSVYLGLPASPHAAWTGYVDPETMVSKVLPIVQRSHNYGGVALWNRFWDVQTGYSMAVRHAV